MTLNWRPIARRSSILIAVIALVITIGLYIVQREFNLFVQIGLGLFIIGIAVYIALNPGEIRTALTGRQAKHGSNALVLTIAFLGILVVVNYFVFKNNKQWDLTADKSNTLAAETIDVLHNLPNSVVAKAFFTNDSAVASSKESAKVLFDKYVYESDGKFQYEFIDPNRDPVAAEGAGITKDASIVLFSGEAKQSVASISEEQITGALLRLMNPEQHMVYFLTGHGEYSVEESGDQSYSQLKSDLEGKNYTVSSLNLISTPQIPADATVIVIAGPQKPLSDSEVGLLSSYIDYGGSLVIMEDPTIVTQFGDTPDPLANYLAQTIGIILGNDIVVDLLAQQSMQQPYIAIANAYADHSITQKMDGMTSLYPQARSVKADAAIGANYTKTELVLTANQSWAETNMDSVKDGTAQADDGVDLLGPVPLVVAAQGTANDARIVVFGDSDFAADASFQAYGNGTMLVNSIDWAAKEENLISLSARTTIERRLVQPQANTMGLIFLGSIVLMPGLILLTGVWTWIRRKKQG